jgi:deoxyribodipyrimidine photolyase-related protein
VPGALRLVLADQLSRDLSALDGLDPAADTVLMAEVAAETDYVPHHPKKIAFLFSAMRHFAEALREDGATVRYIKLTADHNSGSIPGELTRAVDALSPDTVIMTECGEYRLQQSLADWEDDADVPVEIRPDTRFLASKDDFARWAKGRKQLRMEYFYREMRRRYDILMEPNGDPMGGKWNYDAENRKTLSRDDTPPPPMAFKPDAVTMEVLALVERRFAGNAGSLENFRFAVTTGDAKRCAADFIKRRLPRFGDFQDAMARDEPFLYHALIGLYLNAGLLDPLDMCKRAERAYRDGDAPLNAVEGFIRQILGWREYVRGIYWLKMPDYAETNHLNAQRDLPSFYWTGDTKLTCLATAIGQTLEEAYAHHIQRLMVTGNFALLAGIAPKQVSDWYLAVYADAYEWVELPNTHGMALFADGGVLGSKPYAASGKYIDRMSDYCADCVYDPKKPTGPDACPFNYLYWDFLDRNAEALDRNPRMGMIYKTWGRMDPTRKDAIRRDAKAFLEELT